ncbi:MAG: hypothetical protein V1881_00540 [Candidatus Micrarchaeota archaeon]
MKLLAAFIILGVLEALLISLGFLPPVSCYDAGNLAFSVAMAALLVYAGWKRVKPKEAALEGAVLMGASAAALCAVGLLSKALGGNPVLGIAVPSTVLLVAVIAFLIAMNALLGAIVEAAASFAASFCVKGKRKK